MAHDAALGVNYLHSLVPPVIHSDLKSLNLVRKEEKSWGKDCERGEKREKREKEKEKEKREILIFIKKEKKQLVDGNWLVKVADFGESKIKHCFEDTHPGDLGTPAWSAPEVLFYFIILFIY